MLYFSVFRDWLSSRLLYVGYFDELIAVFAIPIILIRISENKLIIQKNNNSYWKYIFVLVISGITGSVLYKYQPIKAGLSDVILCLKFWLAIEVGEYCFDGFSIEKKANSIFTHVRFLTLFLTFLIVFDHIHPIFRSTVRYGLRAEQLFYNHPTEFASVIIFLMIVIVMLRKKISSNKTMFYLMILSALAATSLRTKIWGCILSFWMIYYFAYYRKKEIKISTVLFFVFPILIFISWDQIEYYFLGEIQQESARYQLLAKSIVIAKNHFPFGAGFGTFGSHYSTVYYSPVYYKYGLSKIYGLQKGYAYFVSDNFWPMILGQFGVIGFLGIFVAIYKLFNQINCLRKSNVVFYVAGLNILVYLLIESTAASSFVNPSAIPYALLLGYLLHFNKFPKCFQTRKKYKSEKI